MGVASAEVYSACHPEDLRRRRGGWSAASPPAGPMVRSRLPLPTLLGLFGALLMLSPELLTGVAGTLCNVPATDPGLQKALAFSVEQYNQDRKDRANYFKQLRVVKVQSQDTTGEYHLTLEFVETSCRKTAGRRMKYEMIQKCELLPANPEKLTCYLRVIPRSQPNEMYLINLRCA